MAPAQTLHGHGAAFGNAITANGFGSVLGTTGLKPAGRAKKRAQAELVEADEDLNESRHF